MIETISAMMLFKFLMVLAFAFLTGLEMREYFFSKSDIFIFGTVRTITFIGVLGFVMSVIGQKAYLLGFASVSAFLLLFYFQNIQMELYLNNKLQQFGDTDLMIYKPTKIIKEILTFMSLEDGDIIMSGTPKGVATYSKNDKFEVKIHVDGELKIKKEFIAQ